MSVRNIRSAAEMIVYSRGSDAAKRYIASDEFKKLKTRVVASPTRVVRAVPASIRVLSNPEIFDLVLVTKVDCRTLKWKDSSGTWTREHLTTRRGLRLIERSSVVIDVDAGEVVLIAVMGDESSKA